MPPRAAVRDPAPGPRRTRGTPTTRRPPRGPDAYAGSVRRIRSARDDGRVFLAGDRAHMHAPAGGQGPNTGVRHDPRRQVLDEPLPPVGRDRPDPGHGRPGRGRSPRLPWRAGAGPAR
ncbi:FAD-dependent monooxygenase [Streptomyces sp. NPDC090021]|uniref:FAD-dependent monooxygenase n=1 Tax=Streptomyces sp. NPDC090021 TaxID=3365919 RepID=UPI00381906D2